MRGRNTSSSCMTYSAWMSVREGKVVGAARRPWTSPPSYMRVRARRRAISATGTAQSEQSSIIHQPPKMGNPAGETYPGVPPPHYPGTGPVPTTVTMVTAVAVGPEPTRLTCPHCHSQVTTTVEHSANSRTHLFAILLCLICPLGCCLIPYCTNSCMGATHSCPVCHQHLGTYER